MMDPELSSTDDFPEFRGKLPVETKLKVKSKTERMLKIRMCLPPRPREPPSEPLNDVGSLDLKILSSTEAGRIVKKSVRRSVPSRRKEVKGSLLDSSKSPLNDGVPSEHKVRAGIVPRPAEPAAETSTDDSLVPDIEGIQQAAETSEKMEQIRSQLKSYKVGHKLAKDLWYNPNDVRKRQLRTAEMKEEEKKRKEKLLPKRIPLDFPEGFASRLNSIRDNIWMLYNFLGKKEKVSCRICLQHFSEPHLNARIMGVHVMRHSMLPLFTCRMCVNNKEKEPFTSSSQCGLLMRNHLLHRHKISISFSDKKFRGKISKLTLNHCSEHEDILLIFLEKCFGVPAGERDPFICPRSSVRSPGAADPEEFPPHPEMNVNVAEIVADVDRKHNILPQNEEGGMIELHGGRQSRENLAGEGSTDEIRRRRAEDRRQNVAELLDNTRKLEEGLDMSCLVEEDESVHSAGISESLVPRPRGDLFPSIKTKFRKRSHFDSTINAVMRKSKKLVSPSELRLTKRDEERMERKRLKRMRNRKTNETIPESGKKPLRLIKLVEEIAEAAVAEGVDGKRCSFCLKNIRLGKGSKFTAELAAKTLLDHVYAEIEKLRQKEWVKEKQRGGGGRKKFLFRCTLCGVETNTLFTMERHIKCRKVKQGHGKKQMTTPLRLVKDTLYENEELLIRAVTELFCSGDSNTSVNEEERIFRPDTPEPSSESSSEEEEEEEQTAGSQEQDSVPLRFHDSLRAVMSARLEKAVEMKCRLCPMVFSKTGKLLTGKVNVLTLGNLARHAQRHSQLPLLQCLLCETAFCSYGLEDHLKATHNETPRKETARDSRKEMEEQLLPWVHKCYGAAEEEEKEDEEVESTALEFFRLVFALYEAGMKTVPEGSKKLVFVCQLCGGSCSCYGHHEYLRHHILLELVRTRSHALRRSLFCCLLCNKELNTRRDIQAHVRVQHGKNLKNVIEDRTGEVEGDLLEVCEECFPLAKDIRASRSHQTRTGEAQRSLGELILKYGPQTAEEFRAFVQGFRETRERAEAVSGERPEVFWSVLAELFPFSLSNEKMKKAKRNGEEMPSLQCVLCNELFSLDSCGTRLHQKIEQHVIWEMARKRPSVLSQSLFQCLICGWETNLLQGCKTHAIHDKEYNLTTCRDRLRNFSSKLKSVEYELIKVLGECFPDTKSLLEYENALAAVVLSQETLSGPTEADDTAMNDVESDPGLSYKSDEGRKGKRTPKKSGQKKSVSSKPATALNNLPSLSSKVKKHYKPLLKYARPLASKAEIVYTDVSSLKEGPAPKSEERERAGPSAGTRGMKWRNPLAEQRGVESGCQGTEEDTSGIQMETSGFPAKNLMKASSSSLHDHFYGDGIRGRESEGAKIPGRVGLNLGGRPQGKNAGWYRKFLTWDPPEDMKLVAPEKPLRKITSPKPVEVKETGVHAMKKFVETCEDLLLEYHSGKDSIRCRLCWKKFGIGSLMNGGATKVKELSTRNLTLHAFQHLGIPLFVCLVCGFGLTCDGFKTGELTVKMHTARNHDPRALEEEKFHDRRLEQKDRILGILHQAFGNTELPQTGEAAMERISEETAPPLTFLAMVKRLHDNMKKELPPPPAQQKIVLKCQLCNRNCSCLKHEVYISDHVTLHMAEDSSHLLKEEMFSCNLCRFSSNHRRHLQAHIRDNHGTNLDSGIKDRRSGIQTQLIRIFQDCFPEAKEVIEITAQGDQTRKNPNTGSRFWSEIQKNVRIRHGLARRLTESCKVLK